MWKYENQEKDLDIVYLASIQDPEQIIRTVKETFLPNLVDTFMDMFHFLKQNLHNNIWDIYKKLFYKQLSSGSGNKTQHAVIFYRFFSNLSYLLSYTKRIELVKSMEDVGIKVWGNPEWQKYISGKNEYMGSANFEDAMKILPRAKVSLNLQPIQLLEGIHDRIINSVMTESAVLCDSAPEIKKVFGNSITYYDAKNFTDIKQKALTLLSDENLRRQKVEAAKRIVLRDHTWESRAKTMRSIMFQEKQKRKF